MTLGWTGLGQLLIVHTYAYHIETSMIPYIHTCACSYTRMKAMAPALSSYVTFRNPIMC